VEKKMAAAQKEAKLEKKFQTIAHRCIKAACRRGLQLERSQCRTASRQNLSIKGRGGAAGQGPPAQAGRILTARNASL